MPQVMLMKRWRGYVFTLCCIINPSYAQTSADNFTALIEKCAPDVSSLTMSYLLKVESNYAPFSLHINSKPVAKLLQFNDAISAIAMANQLIAEGNNIDMGLGQINSASMQKLGLSVAEMYDPCLNISASATILKACYRRAKVDFQDDQQALKHALSCYNTGHLQHGIANGYVNKLQKLATTQTLVVPALLAEPESLPATSLNREQGGETITKEGEEDAFGTAANQDAFSRRSK